MKLKEINYLGPWLVAVMIRKKSELANHVGKLVWSSSWTQFYVCTDDAKGWFIISGRILRGYLGLALGLRLGLGLGVRLC